MTKFQKFLQGKGIAEDSLKSKNFEELAGIYNQFNEAQWAEVESAIEGKATKADVKAMLDEVSRERDAQLKALNEAVKTQGIILKRVEDGGRSPKATSAEEYRKSLEDAHKRLNEIANKGSKEAFSIDVSIKAVGDMSITGNVTGEIPQSYRIPGMNRIQDRRPFIRQFIRNASVSKTNLITWVEQANREGSVGGTAEGAAKNQIDFDLIEESEKVVKRTGLITVTTEMLEDIEFMQSEINRELEILLNLDVDNQILQGDGIAPNLNGIITQATTYSAGVFAGTVNSANNYDVLLTAIDQVEAEDFMPNVALINTRANTAMKLEKLTDGDYLKYPDLGIPIVRNNGIPTDSFVVMDGSRATIYDRDQITMRMGYTGDDFKHNRMTIIIEWRGALVIQGNDIPAFVAGVFTTAKAALETP